MYLTARRYVSEYSDKELSTELNELTKDIRKGYNVQGFTVEAMYWRKANAIHNWFVKTVQFGIDDCKKYEVDTDQLKELLNIVTAVLDKTAEPEDVLPSTAGFFFGDSEYNERYFENLEYTKEELTKLLENFGEDGRWSFDYQSSW